MEGILISGSIGAAAIGVAGLFLGQWKIALFCIGVFLVTLFFLVKIAPF